MASKTKPNSRWIDEFRKKLVKLVLRGDYKSALKD